ncbi:hypothetical protein [Candidatus Poriferisodalis sp.]|uniref:hypothetical protein n=1 Tax=Candidatus Poriferisodalis sp. TaxID=3101277 RepID=UPI003B52040D
MACLIYVYLHVHFGRVETPWGVVSGVPFMLLKLALMLALAVALYPFAGRLEFWWQRRRRTAVVIGAALVLLSYWLPAGWDLLILLVLMIAGAYEWVKLRGRSWVAMKERQ